MKEKESSECALLAPASVKDSSNSMTPERAKGKTGKRQSAQINKPDSSVSLSTLASYIFTVKAESPKKKAKKAKSLPFSPLAPKISSFGPSSPLELKISSFGPSSLFSVRSPSKAYGERKLELATTVSKGRATARTVSKGSAPASPTTTVLKGSAPAPTTTTTTVSKSPCCASRYPSRLRKPKPVATPPLSPPKWACPRKPKPAAATEPSASLKLSSFGSCPPMPTLCSTSAPSPVAFKIDKNHKDSCLCTSAPLRGAELCVCRSGSTPLVVSNDEDRALESPTANKGCEGGAEDFDGFEIFDKLLLDALM